MAGGYTRVMANGPIASFFKAGAMKSPNLSPMGTWCFENEMFSVLATDTGIFDSSILAGDP